MTTMYTPLSEELMFQEAHERADKFRNARRPATAGATRPWWRRGSSTAGRRTR
jgi:hypothetical protein